MYLIRPSSAYLIAIYWIIVFEGIDTSNRKGHCKADNCNSKAVSYGVLENFHTGCNRGLKSEFENSQNYMSPTCSETQKIIEQKNG